VKCAEDGVLINEEVVGCFGDIREHVDMMAQAMRSIADASDGHAHAVAQIDTSVAQMTKVTAHVSGSAQASASAAEQLSGQSHSLTEMVADFTLSRAGAPAGKAAGAKRHPSERRRAA
jgi:methyl-accepting chemotaxis protein